MDTWVWIVIGVFVAIVVLGVVFSALRTRRSRSLQDQFGREYDRTVDKAGGRREAERELAERQKRHDELELKPLSQDARERYLQQWQVTQGRFVDDPTGAVSEADDLVQQGDAGPGLSGRRLRAAGGRHLGRASRARREVPDRERHRPRQ